MCCSLVFFFFFFQAEDGIRYFHVTGVQTCALPISLDPDTKWFFLLATIVGGGFIWWSCVRLKRVRMDDKALYISNYSTEIAVPWVNVAQVSANRWINIHPVTTEFHAGTEFASRLVSMPHVRSFAC